MKGEITKLTSEPAITEKDLSMLIEWAMVGVLCGTEPTNPTCTAVTMSGSPLFKTQEECMRAASARNIGEVKKLKDITDGFKTHGMPLLTGCRVVLPAAKF